MEDRRGVRDRVEEVGDFTLPEMLSLKSLFHFKRNLLLGIMALARSSHAHISIQFAFIYNAKLRISGGVYCDYSTVATERRSVYETSCTVATKRTRT